MTILVYGAGGHGKVVADILLASGQSALGFLDDHQSLHGNVVMGLPVLGGKHWLKEEIARHRVMVALGIGDNKARQQLANRCAILGVEVAMAIHPSATISVSATIGPGTVVMAGAVINPSANIGAGAIINSGAVVEHDVVIGDYAHVSPNGTMGGSSRLGALSHLGLGAVILPGIAVGTQSIVGAGAVVTTSLGDAITAMGVPARVRTAK
jgi:sugar O-acyltransferase (sialic acid O-acetyltransferase NeuD family)